MAIRDPKDSVCQPPLQDETSHQSPVEKKNSQRRSYGFRWFFVRLDKMRDYSRKVGDEVSEESSALNDCEDERWEVHLFLCVRAFSFPECLYPREP